MLVISKIIGLFVELVNFLLVARNCETQIKIVSQRVGRGKKKYHPVPIGRMCHPETAKERRLTSESIAMSRGATSWSLALAEGWALSRFCPAADAVGLRQPGAMVWFSRLCCGTG